MLLKLCVFYVMRTNKRVQAHHFTCACQLMTLYCLYNANIFPGPGFLARVQALLTSPPSVSQYLTTTNTGQNDSLSTDVVLEGDRPWEKTVAL